ncbi:MAG TPA: transaldolase [Candidatus Omnitrophota bacterium]|nr:transaldolase [Candidatus Omnitrophota bacterium]HPD85157.1 transaldolase [Candidatus Omnitrophota bacterium]HRZ04342.1 transaldolase [Candidatus Omnitrophota bacterium]
MAKTSVQELTEFGQSIWLDYISQSLFKSGRLKELIDLGVTGMTSNPTIFNDAVSSGADYDDKISGLSEQGKGIFEIYDEISVQDIREAADIFRPVYEHTGRRDGYVSLEVDPRLAMDTNQSIAEGVRLFKKINRPNVMIKIPATRAGCHVIEELLAQGINVNATLIFSLGQYADTAWAFLKGMNRLSHTTKDLSKTRSVASVFVSRTDTAVDQLIDQKAAGEKNDNARDKLLSLKGKAAGANCRVIFEKFNRMFSSDIFKSLSKKNCHPQRVLWASTGTKNPSYSDIKYIEELIAAPTVNTLPEKTIRAFLDHGTVKEALGKDSSDARQILKYLCDAGIDVDKICEKLLVDGVAAFEKSFDSLFHSIETKARSLAARS